TRPRSCTRVHEHGATMAAAQAPPLIRDSPACRRREIRAMRAQGKKDLRPIAGKDALACGNRAPPGPVQLLSCSFAGRGGRGPPLLAPFALSVAAAGRGVEGWRLLRLRRCAPTLSTNGDGRERERVSANGCNRESSRN